MGWATEQFEELVTHINTTLEHSKESYSYTVGQSLSAEYAEEILSPGYRDASSAAFDAAQEAYPDQRVAAEAIVFNSLRSHFDAPSRAWEARRLAALTELEGTDLGLFKEYFDAKGGETKPNDLTVQDLAPGRPEIVRINSQIMDRNATHEEPIDFLESALDVIDARPTSGKKYRGPENYATALKYFADKYTEFPSTHLSRTLIKGLVDRAMDGFIDIAEKDKPNFVEMTNIFATIRTLPIGTFDQRFTPDIVKHSLEQLPSFNSRTLAVSLAAMAKLDLSKTGNAAADYIDLALRKGRSFETTRDMRQALRAVANLPVSPASNRVFATFLEIRNNLEEPLDLEGADDINEHLLLAVNMSVSDPELRAEAKRLAGTCAQRAVNYVREQERRGEITTSQLQQLKETAKRTVNNYYRI